MKKNEDEKAFLEWMKQLEPEELPKRVEKKIHKEVIKKIRADQRKEKKHLNVPKWAVAAASVLVTVGALPLAIYAASNQHLFGVFVNDKRMEEYADTERIVGEPEVLPEGVELGEGETKEWSIEINSHIINANSFDDSFPLAISSVSDVVIEEEIPSIVMGMNAMSVLCREDYEGWYLKKGQILTVEYDIDGYYHTSDGTGESMIFGYVTDGKYYEVDSKKDVNFTFRLEAPKDGIYYPTIQNAAIGYIKITDGQVKVK